MDTSKIVQIAFLVLVGLVVISSAQDYLNYDDDTSDNTRAERIEIVPIVRVRRQGPSENVRHRRQGGGGGEGVTGPVHTFVKTDEHAHFKWGVRHHVGHEYAGR